jgi:hypothetical protein
MLSAKSVSDVNCKQHVEIRITNYLKEAGACFNKAIFISKQVSASTTLHDDSSYKHEEQNTNS